jgi:hypothetical protein
MWGRLRWVVVVLLIGLWTPLVRADTPNPDAVDYTLHDSNPDIDCDVVHLKVPPGWAAKGQVQWNPTVMMPGRWYVCATNLSGPELWIRYPGQLFVWRDNFNLLGVNFQLHRGDADPALGEEIEQPLDKATDCIQQVIIPRFRKDLAQATTVTETEMSPDDAAALANAVVPDVMNTPQIQITPKAARLRLEYPLAGKTVQEEIHLLVLYLDLPGNNGAVHIWTIPYCASFRAEKGKLDDELQSVAKPIADSLKPVADWNAKRDDVIKQAAAAYGDKLRQLAAAQESDIIANMNRNIFNMTQQSYHRRMEMEQQTFHNMDNAIVGRSDYTLPSGKVIEAPITPMGETAWQDGSGQVKFFKTGENPNGTQMGTFQEMTEK